MNYFRYLKKSFPSYIISGVLFGLALLSLVIFHRYNNYLDSTLETMNNINIRRDDIRKEIGEIDSLIMFFNEKFGINSSNINSEQIILRGLDELKTKFDAASISVTKFEEAGSEKKLPVDIKVPVKSYKMVLDYIGYVEAFRLPAYRIKNIIITKEQAGGVVLNIQGEFITPSTANSQQLSANN